MKYIGILEYKNITLMKKIVEGLLIVAEQEQPQSMQSESGRNNEYYRLWKPTKTYTHPLIYIQAHQYSTYYSRQKIKIVFLLVLAFFHLFEVSYPSMVSSKNSVLIHLGC